MNNKNICEKTIDLYANRDYGIWNFLPIKGTPLYVMKLALKSGTN